MLSRLSALCVGALLLASSSVHAAVLALTATTMNGPGGTFGSGVARFTVTWDVDPAEGAVIAVSCSDSAGLALSSYLTNPGADLTFNAPATALGNYLSFPSRTTPVNRLTDKLVTCTVTLAGYTAGQTTFYVGGILVLSNNVPAGLAAPGTSYNLSSSVNPSVTISIYEDTSSLSVSCGAGGGSLDVSTQDWTVANGATTQTLVWTAPAIPVTPITCTYSGPAPVTPSNALFEYYTKSAQFTMTIPTIALAAFTGTVLAGGGDVAVAIALSPAATALQLTAACMSGGSPYGSIPAFTVSGTSATFNFGSTLVAAATAVTCTLARSGGDALFTNAAASNTVGPFNVTTVANLSLSARTMNGPVGTFGALPDGGRTSLLTGSSVARFTVTWDVDPIDQSVIAVSCSDSAGLALSSYLTNPGADLTFTTGTMTLGNWLTLPSRTTAVNRITNNLVTCTATLAGYTAGHTTFYVGGILVLSNNVPAGLAAPGTSYTLLSAVYPNLTMAIFEDPEQLSVSCGVGGGLVAGVANTTQSWTAANGATTQSIVWTAPAIPMSPITCTYAGPTPVTPSNALFEYYTKSAQFTMTIPTITLAAFTGTVTTGTDTAVTITLSAAATGLQLTATCISGGSPYGSIPAFTVSGTSATFNFGSTLVAAATAVTCTLARSGGDALFTNAAASNTVGPFTVTSITASNPVIAFLHPPIQLAVGDTLQLRTILVSVDPLTALSDLRYQWRCSSHPQLQLADTAATIVGPANTSSIELQSGVITSAGVYVFAVSVVDASHRRTAAGLPPTGTASASVSIVPAVVLSSTAVDPCAASPCKHGGRCVATQSAPQSALYTLSCLCPTSPVAFFGPTCSFAIVACPGCVGGFRGGALMTLYGIGMLAVSSISIAGRPIPFSAPVLRDASWSDDVRLALESMQRSDPAITQLQACSFVTPALVTLPANSTVDTTYTQRRLLQTGGTILDDPTITELDLAALVNPISAYYVLTARAVLAGSSAVQQLNFTNLVFYSSSACVAVGVWRDDGLGGCLACPAGGSCPGGGRLWPLAGYWSYSEFLPPIKCTFPDACPGVDPRVVATSASLGATQTQVCGAAYAGPRCAQCADEYFQQNDRCYYCGSSVDQTRDMSLTIISAFIAMCALAMAVALLPAVELAATIQAFVVMQGVAMIGVQGVKHSPFASEQLSIAFTWINLINMDIGSNHTYTDGLILRPGCGGVPTLTYVRKFQLTLLFMFLSATLFVLACLLRLVLNVRKRRIDPQQVDVDNLLVDEDEAEEAAAVTDGRPKATRLVSVVRRLVRPPPQLSLRMRLARFRRSSEWHDASQRLQHSWLILGAIFYLRLNILQLKAFMCAMAPDPLLSFASDAPQTQSLYLIEDMQTRCYEGTHLVTVVFVILLLLCYSIGFPLFCFVLLMRSFANARTPGLLGWIRGRFTLLQGKKKVSRKKGSKPTAVAMQPAVPGESTGGDSAPHKATMLAFSAESAALPSVVDSADPAEPTPEQIHADRVNRYGYLFSSYRYSHFASCLLVFAVQFVVACITVLIPDSDALRKLFAFGLLWTVHTLILAVQLPFEAWTVNARKVLIGLATLAHSTVMLGLQSDGSRSTFLFVLLAMFCALVMLLLVRRRVPRWCGCARRKRQKQRLMRKATVVPSGAHTEVLSGTAAPVDDDDDDDDDDEIEAHNAWITQGEDDELVQPIALEDAAPAEPSAHHDAQADWNRGDDMVTPLHADSASACIVVDSPRASPPVPIDVPPSPPPVYAEDDRCVSPRSCDAGPELPLVVEDLSRPNSRETQPLSAFTIDLRASLPAMPCMLHTLCKQLELHPPSMCVQSHAHWTDPSILPTEAELLRVLDLCRIEYSYSVQVLLSHLSIDRRKQTGTASSSASCAIIETKLGSLQQAWSRVGSEIKDNTAIGTPSAIDTSESFLAPLFAAAGGSETASSSSSSSASPAASCDRASIAACIRSLVAIPRALAFLTQLVEEASALSSMWLEIERLYAQEQQGSGSLSTGNHKASSSISTGSASQVLSCLPPLRLSQRRSGNLGPTAGHVRSSTRGSIQMHIRVPELITQAQAEHYRIVPESMPGVAEDSESPTQA